MGDTLPTHKVGVFPCVGWVGHVKQGENMSTQENRTKAAKRANDLITQVRGAKEVSATARQEIAELAQHASDVGVSKGFIQPVVEALKQTAKNVCAAVLSIERTTSFNGKNPATMTHLGHLLYQIHAAENPFSFGKRQRQNPLTRAEFAAVKQATGNVGDGLTQTQAIEAGYMTADGEPITDGVASEPMADAEMTPIHMTQSQIADFKAYLESKKNV